jgi:hypothetical protein
MLVSGSVGRNIDDQFHEVDDASIGNHPSVRKQIFCPKNSS